MCLSQLTSLELQYVSPKLLMCRDLELAVPGTYDPNQPIIRIQSIAPSLQVITSKQRPRKLTIMGKPSASTGLITWLLRPTSQDLFMFVFSIGVLACCTYAWT